MGFLEPKTVEKKAVEPPEIKVAEAPGKKVEEDYYSPAPCSQRRLMPMEQNFR